MPKNAETLEKIAVSDLRTNGWTLRRIRHWQRRIWKAKEAAAPTQRRAAS